MGERMRKGAARGVHACFYVTRGRGRRIANTQPRERGGDGRYYGAWGPRSMNPGQNMWSLLPRPAPWRVGTPSTPTSKATKVTCTLPGGHNARSLGEHAMSCVACAGKRTTRHDLVRDAIAATLRRHAEGRITLEVEPDLVASGLLPRPDLSEERKATALEIRADLYKQLRWRSSFPGRRSRASITRVANGNIPLNAAEHALARKRSKYAKFFGNEAGDGPPLLGHLSVVHLAFVSYGGTLPSTAMWLKQVAEVCHLGPVNDKGEMADPTGEMAAMMWEMRARIGVALQTGNAQCPRVVPLAHAR